MKAAATTPTAITSLDDTTQVYVQEEPLDDWTPPVDETLEAVINLNEDDEAAATRTTITFLNDDDTTQEYREKLLESQREMEASSAAAATPTAITSLDDTNQEYVQEEVPLESRTSLVEEKEVGAVISSKEDDEAEAPTPTATTSPEDAAKDFDQEQPVESQTPLVDGGEVAVKLDEDGEDIHAFMARTLPRHVIIQSNVNNRYLRFNRENPEIPNALQFAGDYSFGLESRFEIVPSTTVTGLVHIRSLYNNRYLANYNRLVIARAEKPEENQRSTHCTLFQPVFMDSNNRVLRLLQVNTRLLVRFLRGTGNHYGALVLMPGNGVDELFTFIDWKSVVVFPDLIRIKNISNENHLMARTDEYIDIRNKADNSSRFDFEVIPSRDGGIRLKSVVHNTYWSEESNTYIWLKPGTAHNTNTVFIPTAIPGRGVLFRSLRSGRFCRRHDIRGRPAWRNLLAARNTFPDDEAHMEIEEPVISRRITDVTYRFEDALIYNQDNSALITDGTNNRTTQTIEGEFNLRRTVTNSASWSNSVTWRVGVSMSLSVGIPRIGSAGFEISTEFSEERSWGETKEESEEVGNVRRFPVPPMRRVEGRLLATRASYDIPFSYTQRDILSNGLPRNTRKHDGIFTGRNGYGYDYEFVELPLP